MGKPVFELGEAAGIAGNHRPRSQTKQWNDAPTRVQDGSSLGASTKCFDNSKVESQAARHCWPRVISADFRRDAIHSDVNALHNYGYTVLRATAFRAPHSTVGIVGA